MALRQPKEATQYTRFPTVILSTLGAEEDAPCGHLSFHGGRGLWAMAEAQLIRRRARVRRQKGHSRGWQRTRLRQPTHTQRGTTILVPLGAEKEAPCGHLSFHGGEGLGRGV